MIKRTMLQLCTTNRTSSATGAASRLFYARTDLVLVRNAHYRYHNDRNSQLPKTRTWNKQTTGVNSWTHLKPPRFMKMTSGIRQHSGRGGTRIQDIAYHYSTLELTSCGDNDDAGTLLLTEASNMVLVGEFPR
jgi:hypothetical protein